MHQCNFCGQPVERFLPYRGGSLALPELQVKLDVIGSNVDQFACPTCGCHDRERHLKLYLEATGVLQAGQKLRILHFAPEPLLLGWMAALQPEIHIRADLHSDDPRYERIDIESIPYSDESFDCVIANHVLEHVQSPDKALSEINRVLKPDGIAILQTPYSALLEHTFEDPGITSPEQCLYFYGQEDHVRMFGGDIFARFSEYLTPMVREHAEFFDEDIANQHGVNGREPFFLYTRKPSSSQTLEPPAITAPRPPADNVTPEVSVYCITYNHEKFIRNALDGFLFQRTTFDYEIVIGEDASTDRTREIIQEYQQLYPGRIRLLPAEPNMGMHRNCVRTLAACTGRYVAFCEGDDYWTDPEKLQKQWSYLEAHPTVVMTYGSVQAHHAGQIDMNYLGGLKQDCVATRLFLAPPINTLTVMFRNVVKVPVEIVTCGPCDLFLWSLLSWHGSGHYDPRVLPSIYTMHDGGVHSMRPTKEKEQMHLMTLYSLYLFYRRIGAGELADWFLQIIANYLSGVRATSAAKAHELLSGAGERMVAVAEGVYDFDQAPLALLLDQQT